MKKQAPKPKNELNIDEFQADPLLGAGVTVSGMNC
jgi:hypothetical protein